jgi:hypothetical protein
MKFTSSSVYYSKSLRQNQHEQKRIKAEYFGGKTETHSLIYYFSSEKVGGKIYKKDKRKIIDKRTKRKAAQMRFFNLLGEDRFANRAYTCNFLPCVI